MEIIGHLGNLGMGILGAWGGYVEAKLNARRMEAQADSLGAEASGRLKDAESYNASAGGEQRAGLESAALRTRQLGEDIGRIYAGAAAGNIDVGASRTVREVDSASRVMAGQDVDAISASAAGRAASYQAQAQGARADAGRIAAQAEMQRIQARYTRKVGRTKMRAGIWSAAGQFVQNVAGVMG